MQQDAVQQSMTPGEVVIYREPNDDEASSVAALHALSWRSAYRGQLPDGYLDSDVLDDRARVWTQRFGNRVGTLTVVASDPNGLVGFAHSILDEDPEWGTLLDNLHVSPNRKRAGVGARLVHESVRRIADRASTAGIHLWVHEANASARAFYEHLGGSITGAGTSHDGGGSAPIVRYAWADLGDLRRRSARETSES